MWADLIGNTSRHELGSRLDTSNTNDEQGGEATNPTNRWRRGGEFGKGRGGPREEDVSSTATV